MALPFLAQVVRGHAWTLMGTATPVPTVGRNLDPLAGQKQGLRVSGEHDGALTAAGPAELQPSAQNLRERHWPLWPPNFLIKARIY
jgi:hypothetical protein